MLPAHDRILRQLLEQRVPYRLIHRDLAPQTRQLWLTTVAFHTGRGQWTLAVIRLGDTIDLDRLARVVGVRPADLSPASADDARWALGCDPEGLAPIAPVVRARVIFDEAVTQIDIAWCGSGRDDRMLEIRVRDLLDLTGGRVVQLVKA
ncbi:MAG TPA: YbaK/EbsC family protein [Thermomicrobiales bacterium]|nr:YbaK/EbsC family protein [Thermomicrobiales bacterium]HQZ89316.1 YbaK/EbsC family protein [Thermomicrobiales bacterium]HRA32771.1 YbaK/EbsC family protein [Thermomicrobiales bacterium]